MVACADIVTVPRSDLIPETAARAILFQAGLGAKEIAAFLAANPHHSPAPRARSATPDSTAVVTPASSSAAKPDRT